MRVPLNIGKGLMSTRICVTTVNESVSLDKLGVAMHLLMFLSMIDAD